MAGTGRSERRSVAIAYIGGGSRQWAMRLMGDLALDPGLSGELRLYDIEPEAARHNEALGRAIFSRPEAERPRGAEGFRVGAVDTIREALLGADYFVISIDPGPTEARYADLVIPARHGIVQTVGDTTGPGGLLRALRAVPMMEEIARQIMAACPGARVINYTNPMTLCMAALYAAAPGIKAQGCCHEVFAIQERVAGIVGAEEGLPTPSRHEIELDIAGVNHFTLATGLRWRGRDLLPLLRSRALAARTGRPPRFPDATAQAEARRDGERWFDCDGLVSLEFLLRLGVLGAAGDRHLAEFVPWFLADEATIKAYGIPLTPYEWRIKVRDAPRPTAAQIAATPLAPSGEEGVAQIRALLGLGPLRTNLNLPNRGQWPQAPAGSIVETFAVIDEDRITPLVAPPLPPAAMALEARIIAEQALVLEAAMRRDPGLALEALLLDPLVHLPPVRAEAMLGQMLDHAAAWLPGWPGAAAS